MKKIYTFLGLAFFTLNTFSTTLVVNNLNDSGSGSLREAITNASTNDTITFNPSISGGTININTTITVNKNLIFIGTTPGANIVISGNHSFRLLSISGSSTNVSISNINFTQGQVSTGGAILNSGTLELNYCRLFDNHSLAVNSNHGGGAIFNNSNAALIINYCEFYDNSALTTTSIPHGGAIYSKGSSVNINYSGFYYNDATSAGNFSYGGAIHNNSGVLNINSSTFSNNESIAASGGASYGGAISSESASSIAIKNSTFFKI